MHDRSQAISSQFKDYYFTRWKCWRSSGGIQVYCCHRDGYNYDRMTMMGTAVIHQ
jgi:hypothetical protein